MRTPSSSPSRVRTQEPGRVGRRPDESAVGRTVEIEVVEGTKAAHFRTEERSRYQQRHECAEHGEPALVRRRPSLLGRRRESGAGHAQRIEHVAGHVALERLIGDVSDHLPEDEKPEVRVRRTRPGIET
jgi:hypothetical protein